MLLLSNKITLVEKYFRMCAFSAEYWPYQRTFSQKRVLLVYVRVNKIDEKKKVSEAIYTILSRHKNKFRLTLLREYDVYLNISRDNDRLLNIL